MVGTGFMGRPDWQVGLLGLLLGFTYAFPQGDNRDPLSGPISFNAIDPEARFSDQILAQHKEPRTQHQMNGVPK